MQTGNLTSRERSKHTPTRSNPYLSSTSEIACDVRSVTGHYRSPLKLVFVTSNRNKVMEARRILGEHGIKFRHLSLRYPEIQDVSIRKIASSSARGLRRRLQWPLFIEDSGLFIEALRGFPGPYSSYVQETIGNQGILKLMEGIQERSSRFESVVAFLDSAGKTHLFTGAVDGAISSEIRGLRWGFDPIFIPHGANQTYAEMGVEAKQRVSHRSIAFEKFATWIMERCRSG